MAQEKESSSSAVLWGGVICVFLAKMKIEFRQPPNLILEGCRRLFPKKMVNFGQKNARTRVKRNVT